MKTKKLLLGSLLLLSGLATVQAQDKKQLTLDEAITLAVTKSTQANLADTRVATSKLDLDNVKNNIYPELKISGQYQRLTQADVNLKYHVEESQPAEPTEGETETVTSSPKVNRLLLGQVSLGMPLFSGFKLKNTINASENLYKAETYNALNTRQQLAMQAIILYVNLYKAQQSVALIQENLKSSSQRVTDFTAMEQNGLLARNDLLKSQLQTSNIRLTLDDAYRRVSTINYQLVTLLKLPDGTVIEPIENIFKGVAGLSLSVSAEDAGNQRADLESLRLQQKASEDNIKVVKGNYYPTLSLVGGYVAFELQNVIEVHNAINFGLGLSYDLSNIFKNNKQVKAAVSRATETRQAVEVLSDRVKVQVQEAMENYNLSLKQDKVYTEAMEQAAENYRIVNDKYENGLSDTNDLLEADVQQLQAKINEAFSKADITQRYYELLNASGKLTDSFNLTSK